MRAPLPTDPFGLRTLDIERLRAKRGTKWQAHPARFAAWVADMDFDVAPAISDALAEVVTRNEFGYPGWGGVYAPSPAAEMFPARMASRYSWEPSADRVHELVDVIQGVRAVVHHHSRPGDGVVVHMPAYHPFLHTVDEMGRRLVAVDWTGDGFDYDGLEQRLVAEPAAVWIVCHPHNPLGRVFERAELERIADIAIRHDLIVVSDEIHADLTMPGHTHIPFETLGSDVSQRTVTITSASKAFNLAGLRWAVMHAGYAPMDDVMRALPGHYLGAPNVMGVTATVAAWTDGGAWLDAVIDVIDENRGALPALLAEHLPGASCRVIEATYLAWVDCRGLGLGDIPAEAFRARGVELSPGVQFGPPSSGVGAGHVRVNIATSPSILADMVRAMAGA